MNFNWVDLVIVVVSLYYLVGGWETGFVFLLFNLVSFLGSLWLALKFHAPVGAFLAEKFGIPTIWSTVLGYIVVAFIAEAILAEISRWIVSQTPKKYLVSRVNQWLGAVVSMLNSFIIVTFFLLVILSLPLRGSIKKDIKNSRLGSSLVQYAERYGGQVSSLLTEVTNEARKFLTVEPSSKERITLPVEPKKTELSIDEASEKLMLELVNNERMKAGVSPLTLNTQITLVARSYSRDMFERRYFSHYSPEGDDVGDRLSSAGISYMYAGENLAYAPDLGTAHEGLMNSEGHKRNILDPGFHKIGIGIIDGGIYGKMFTQNFTD